MRFVRMFSPGEALYEVIGFTNIPRAGFERTLLGHLLVVFDSDQPLPAFDQYWDVEPLGTRVATNGLGGRIQLAVVKFQGFHQSADVSGGVAPTTGVNLQLVEAVNRDDVAAVAALLAQDADPNAEYNDPFRDPCIVRAMTKKHAADMVRLLLRYQADVNRENAAGSTALDWAGSAPEEVAKMLKDAGAKRGSGDMAKQK